MLIAYENTILMFILSFLNAKTSKNPLKKQRNPQKFLRPTGRNHVSNKGGIVIKGGIMVINSTDATISMLNRNMFSIAEVYLVS